MYTPTINQTAVSCMSFRAAPDRGSILHLNGLGRLVTSLRQYPVYEKPENTP